MPVQCSKEGEVILIYFHKHSFTCMHPYKIAINHIYKQQSLLIKTVWYLLFDQTKLLHATCIVLKPDALQGEGYNFVANETITAGRYGCYSILGSPLIIKLTE